VLYDHDGFLNERKRWRPFKVVFTQSNSNGERHKKVKAMCRKLDLKIAEIFGIQIKDDV